MNPFEKMDLKKDSFTKKELILYDVLKDNLQNILSFSASDLSIIFHNQQLQDFVKRLVMMVIMNLNLMFSVLVNKEILLKMIYQL